jgi:hypothetical protein
VKNQADKLSIFTDRFHHFPIDIVERQIVEPIGRIEFDFLSIFFYGRPQSADQEVTRCLQVDVVNEETLCSLGARATVRNILTRGFIEAYAADLSLDEQTLYCKETRTNSIGG